MRAYGVVCLMFLISGALHAREAYMGDDIVPHLSALFANDLHYKSCNFTLKQGGEYSNYYYLSIIDTDTDTEAYMLYRNKRLVQCN